MGYRMIVRGVLWLGLCGLLATTSRAEEFPLLILVQDSPAFRDLTLAVHSRQALLADRRLADLNLAVQVRKGVAELRGRVPSEELSQRAVQLVEDVSGILAVKNYLEIRAISSEPARLLLEVEEPSSTRAALPNREILPEVPLSIPAPIASTVREPVKEPVKKTQPTTTSPAEKSPLVTLLPPVFSAEEPTPVPTPSVPMPPAEPDRLVSRPRPAPTPALVVGARGSIDQVLADPAYRGIHVERRGQVITIYNRSTQAPAVMALARRLSDLPEVEEIVLVPEGR